MATPSKNMPAMTCEIFVHTSNYMKYLIDEISKIPEERVPHGVKQISDELIQSLLKFSDCSPKKVIKLPATNPRNLYPLSGNSNVEGLSAPGKKSSSPASLVNPAKDKSTVNKSSKRESDSGVQNGIVYSSSSNEQSGSEKKKIVLITQDFRPKSGSDSASLPSLNQADFGQANCLPSSGFGRVQSATRKKTVPDKNKTVPKSSPDSVSLPSLSQTDFLPANFVVSCNDNPDYRFAPNKKSFSLASSSTSSPKGDFMDTQSLNNELRKIDFSSLSRTGRPKDPKELDNNISSNTKSSSHSSLDSLNKTKNKSHIVSTFYVTSTFNKIMESIMNSALLNYTSYFFYCRFCNLQINSQDQWDFHLSTKHAKMSARFKSEALRCDECNLVVFGSKNLISKYMGYHDSIMHKDLIGNENKEEKDCDQLQQNIQIKKEGVAKTESKAVDSSPNWFNLWSASTENEIVMSPSPGTVKNNKKRPRKKKANKGATESQLPESVNGESVVKPADEASLEGACALEPDRKSLPDVEKSSPDVETSSPDGSPHYKASEENSSPFQNFIEKAQSANNNDCYGYFCCLCQVYFFSSFSWIDHMDGADHAEKVQKVGTPECNTCNKCKLTFFGEPASVNDCINSYDHVNHDKFVKSLKD